MTTPLQQVIKALGGLSPTDLNTIRLMIDRLTEGTSVQQVEEDSKDEEIYLFYCQIEKALSLKGVTAVPWIATRRGFRFGSFRKKFAEVEKYTAKYFAGISKVRRTKLYRIYALVVISWVEEQQYMPLSARSVLENADRISGFMELAFPGYAEAGLLPMILSIKPSEI